MKTITTKQVTINIPPGCDNTALAQLEAATVGGLAPAKLKFTIILRGSDALAEILEAAASNAAHGAGIDPQRWGAYAMGRAAGTEGE